MEDLSSISGTIETVARRLVRPIPIATAIETLADRLGATNEQAWAEIKSKTVYGRLSFAGIDDKGRPCNLEPHWISYIVPWGVEDPPPDCASTLIGALAPPVRQHPATSDMPRHNSGGIIAFDRERAIRDWRADKSDRRASRSIPPLRIRDVVVDGAQLDDLWARAEYEFQNLDWSLGNVLSWIAYRDPLLICKFESRRELAAKRLAAYDFPRSGLLQRAMVVPLADRLLLDALKEGAVTAIRNGAEIPSSYWFGKHNRHLSDDLRFRRAEALKCWPAETSDTAAVPPQTQTLSAANVEGEGDPDGAGTPIPTSEPEEDYGHETSESAVRRHEQFLSQARAASSFDPRLRRHAVFGLIHDSLWSRPCTPAEILKSAYGDADGWAYWEAWLFEPMHVFQFAKLLAVHRAAVESIPTVSFAGLATPVLDGFFRQVFEALRAAAHSGEQWFMNIEEPGIPVQPPDSALSAVSAQIGEGRNFAVLPRDALAWMIRNPSARHLVPATAAVIAASRPVAATASELNTAPSSGIRTNRASDAQRECEQWIGTLKTRPANKDAAFNAAVAACGDKLSRKAFEHAWANSAPPDWRKAGRRKRS